MKHLFALITTCVACLNLISCSKDSKSHASKSSQTVVLSSSDDPASLDPRTVRDLSSVSYLHLLYEGLMRSNFQGKPISGIASHASHSEDGKTYTFTLKKTQWSNGDPVTADDFVRTWRSLLDPNFPAPNAYQFYVIKGAKDAKEGKIPVEQVGVRATSPDTLVVELESPTPYFLELVSTHFFYPVHKEFSASNPITNGPFKLDSWKRQNEFVVVKNPHFWDASEVRLEKIQLLTVDDRTAMTLFENGDLDWTGSPLSTIPQDLVQPLLQQKKLHNTVAAGTWWFRFNVDKEPFTSQEIRQAFTLALDRKSLVEHVTQGNQKPALAVVPPSFGIGNKYFDDHDVPKAWFAFQAGLEKLKLSKDDFPEITLCYSQNDRNHKIAQAVQQQWSKALGVTIHLNACESQVYFDRLAKKDFQIAIGSWYADFKDPINFLEIFKSKQNKTNNTQWENAQYATLLNASSLEMNPEKRMNQLREAETILMQEMPVAPLFYATFNYMKNEKLLGVYFSELGYVDFTYAFFDEFR